MAVLILSSSRGGSTIFTEFLRRHPGLRHLPGEINPLLREVGLGFPESGSGSDALDAHHPVEALLKKVEEQAGQYGKVSEEQQVEDVLERLRWQWPECTVERAQVEEAVRAAWPFQEDGERFTRELLRFLPLHPGLYDLPGAPSDPPLPSPHILEEPPFILFSPWKRSNQGPLIIKTPSNAYRLPFFKKAFPNLQLLHLTRNPAAAINGLMDGWLFWGFHAHYLEKLEIEGYSKTVAGGEHWWKFDLPPGWQDFVQGKNLVEICAFQWASAHRAILNEKNVGFRVRFEEFLREPLRTMEGVCEWLGVPMEASFKKVLLEGLAPRMATASPRQRRWFARHRELEPILALPEVREVAEALGYHDRETWI